jgi:hypothetical protein
VSDAKFTWNVFFRGKEGYKEHIQAQVEDGPSLGEARTTVLKTLDEIGAKPEEERKTGQNYSRPAQAPSLAGDAAAQGAVSKACPVHGGAMVYKQGGLSRTKTLPNGQPKPYSASLRCPVQGCTQVEWLGN